MELYTPPLVWETTQVYKRVIITHRPLEIYPFEGCWQIWMSLPLLVQGGGPGTSSTDIAWELLRNSDSQALPQTC